MFRYPLAWRCPSTFHALLALLASAMLAGCSGQPSRPAAAKTTTERALAVRSTAEFCVAAQAAIVAARPPARNEVHEDFIAFTKSKPVAEPLLTTQYLWRENADPQAGPMMISCKMKTADHLVDVYGEGAAGADIGCSGVNAITLRQVLESLTSQERRRLRFDGGRKVRFDPDIVTTDGPVWLAPFPLAKLAADGTLRVQAKAMRNDWLDPRYVQAPPQFRGTRYCHLVAPEYLRRLLLGEVEPQQG